MASASAIKAGETFVTMSLEAGEMEKSLKQITRKLNNFASSAAKVGTVMAAIGGVGVAALAKAAAAANQVELVGRRLDAVFGEAADGAREFARALAVDIGDSRFAVEDTMVTFKSFFAEIVAGQDDQKAFSRNMTILSRDFAAFQGMDTTEALQRFISALSGSPEVLDRFGINLKAAALDAEFAAKGLDVTTENATEFQKVIARMDIIERTMSKQGALGKAEAELKTFSGALRAATSAVRDFSVAIGKALLPILKPVIAVFANLARGFETIATHAPIVTVAFGVMVVSTAALGVTILAAAAAATALALALTVATTLVTQYNGYVKKAGMTGASFAAVLRHAKDEVVGFGIGAASAGAKAMGLSASTQAVTSGLVTMRTALISTVAVMGKMAALTVLMSTAMGTVPDSGLGIAVAFALAGAASLLFSKAIKRVSAAAATATATLTAYNTTIWANASVSKKAALWSEVFANKLGIKTKYIQKAGSALKWLRPIITLAGAALTPVGMLVTAIAAGLAILAAIVARFIQLLARIVGLTRVVGDSWKWLKDTLGDIGWIKKVGEAIGWLGDKFKQLWDGAKNVFSQIGDMAAEGWEFLVTGDIAVSRDGASAKGGSFKKQSQEEVDAAKATADRIRELDQRIHDARIAQIKDRSAREKAEVNARFDREIDAIHRAAKERVEAGRLAAIEALKETGAKGDELVAGLIKINSEVPKALLAEMQKASDEIEKTEELRGLALLELAQKQGEEMKRLDRMLQNDLANSRIQGIYEGAALEMAAMKQRHKEELEETKLQGDRLAKLKTRQVIDEANLLAGFAKDAKKSANDAWREATKEGRLSRFEDDDARALASQYENYLDTWIDLNDELKKAEALRDSLSGSQRVDAQEAVDYIESEIAAEQEIFEIRRDNLQKQQAAEKKAREDREAEQRASMLAGLSDQIARMEIDLGGGTDLEKNLAKIDLDRAKAMEEAGDDLAAVLKISKLFGLKKLAAQQVEGAKAAELSGGFGKRQLAGIAPKASKQEQLAQEGNEKLDVQIKVAKEISKMLSNAPFIGGLVP